MFKLLLTLAFGLFLGEMFAQNQNMDSIPVDYNEVSQIYFDKKLLGGYKRTFTKDGDAVYEFEDGSVLYNIDDLVIYEFKSLHDYQSYILWSEQPSADIRKLMEIKDDKFLYKVDLYTSLAIDLLSKEDGSLPTLLELSELLDDIPIEIIKRNRLPLIAYIGEAYKVSNPEARWISTSIFGQYLSVALIDEKGSYYSPPALFTSYLMQGTSFE